MLRSRSKNNQEFIRLAYSYNAVFAQVFESVTKMLKRMEKLVFMAENMV